MVTRENYLVTILNNDISLSSFIIYYFALYTFNNFLIAI